MKSARVVADCVPRKRQAHPHCPCDGCGEISGSRCTDGLRLVQEFLGTPEDLLATELKLAPQLVEQKRIELLLYKLLNQVDSPTARFKVREKTPKRVGGAHVTREASGVEG